MEILFYIFFFFLGSAFASFMNVLVFGEDSVRKALKRKRSKCDRCGKPLVWWELIPVISWIFLYGKCSKCKKLISLYHPISEIFLGSVFVVIYYLFGTEVLLLYGYLFFFIILYFFSMYDIEYGVVRDRWIIPVTFVALVAIIIAGTQSENFVSFVGMRIIAAVSYSLFFIVMNIWSKSGLMPGVKKGKQGFGLGDAKFAPLVGLVLGVQNTIVSCWLGVLTGAVVGVVLMIMKKKISLRIPYVPFMAFGALIALIYGDVIANYFIKMWTF